MKYSIKNNRNPLWKFSPYIELINGSVTKQVKKYATKFDTFDAAKEILDKQIDKQDFSIVPNNE